MRHIETNLLTKRSQYSSMEEAIEKIKEATLNLKSSVDMTVDYLESCEKLVKLNKELGMDKFMEHLTITTRLKNVTYYLQLAIVDMLRYEHDKLKNDN
ncbi:hypothetical protein A6V39_05495 [Candidatus Mycoplasma haematobovis]|uniref:Uncharacterized protein n=1 Tax=Candidatus Mycoplasma haematobovis TaxID=432608 RepID=A0A1A9QCP8_9MOLU|nr:hypothetical protein [Candidatus Mycoplasma haematobovis]OAL09725.1 hypothetical protein A6V39_05495 [Candidatus Mycoplasma haematobovis]